MGAEYSRKKTPFCVTTSSNSLYNTKLLSFVCSIQKLGHAVKILPPSALQKDVLNQSIYEVQYFLLSNSKQIKKRLSV